MEEQAPKAGSRRADLERHVGRGDSVRAIAEAHHVSESTVRHWLKKYGLKTARASRLSAGRAAHRTAKPVARFTCRRHGLTDFVREGDRRYRCLRCRSEAVARRRRKIKETLVQEAGGRCALCGYARYSGALQFHHRDPQHKAFGIAAGGFSRSLEAARHEAAKCVLVCGNCHAEIEGGAANLQRDSSASDV